MQGAMGHPLTVYGTGGQTRAFIHIRDTVRCIEAAIENPPAKGDRVKILNQLAETRSVLDIAARVQALTGTDLSFQDNPRKEAVANDLDICNDTLDHLGVVPTLIEDSLMDEELQLVRKYLNRVKPETIKSKSYWTKEIHDKNVSNNVPSL